MSTINTPDDRSSGATPRTEHRSRPVLRAYDPFGRERELFGGRLASLSRIARTHTPPPWWPRHNHGMHACAGRPDGPVAVMFAICTTAVPVATGGHTLPVMCYTRICGVSRHWQRSLRAHSLGKTHSNTQTLTRTFTRTFTRTPGPFQGHGRHRQHHGHQRQLAHDHRPSTLPHSLPVRSSGTSVEQQGPGLRRLPVLQHARAASHGDLPAPL